MSHTVTISINGCHVLWELKEELKDLQEEEERDHIGAVEDDPGGYREAINVLSGILEQAAVDGFIPRT